MSIQLEEVIKKINEGSSIDDIGIEVKKYLSITTKEFFIKGNEENNHAGSLLATIKEESGVFYIDEILKEILFKMNLVQIYSNINFPEVTTLAEYDKLREYGIDEYVKMKIPQKEYELLEYLIDSIMEQQIKILNSTQRHINKIVGDLIEKMPTERKLKNMLKKLENFDPDKLKTITDLFNFTKQK